MLLRVLENILRSPNPIYRIGSSDGKSTSNGPSFLRSLGGVEVFTKLPSNGFLLRRSLSFQCMRFTLSAGPSSAKNYARSKSFGNCSKSFNRTKRTFNLGPSCEEIPMKKPDEKLSELQNDKDDAIEVNLVFVFLDCCDFFFKGFLLII